jgi:hypothetical protein
MKRDIYDKIVYCCLGTCNETSNTTFICLCKTGWHGIHCETKINYCENITCFNKGVCQPSFLTFTCRCVDDNYSGQYCEVTSNQMVIHQRISKSFAYIAIIAIISMIMFIVTLDGLKYLFGIDVVGKRLKPKAKKQRRKKRRAAPVVIRFVYVNAPST